MADDAGFISSSSGLDLSQLKTLIADLQQAQLSRDMTPVSVNLTPHVKQGQVLSSILEELKGSLDVDNVPYYRNWIPFRTGVGEELVTDQYNQIALIKNDLNNGLQCRDCHVYCGGGCMDTCSNSCSGSKCANNGCENTCSMSCSHSCGHNDCTSCTSCTGCTGGCNDTCYGSCDGGCTDSCSGCGGSCSTDCSGCTSDCSTGCGDCTGSCRGDCDIGCSSRCSDDGCSNCSGHGM